MKEAVIAVGRKVQANPTLWLHVGETVGVRSGEEIFTTVDEHARLGSLPFMPELLQFC